MKKHAPLRDEPVARNYLDIRIQGKVDQIEHDMDPSVVDLHIKETLRKMADVLSAETPNSTKVVDAHASNGKGLFNISYIDRCGEISSQLGERRRCINDLGYSSAVCKCDGSTIWSLDNRSVSAFGSYLLPEQAVERQSIK
jgi:hypothetical protein